MQPVPRARSHKALANDDLIRSAAIDEILRVGVDHVSLRDVGHRAGFTHGATYARYEDVDELLVDLWITVLGQRVFAITELCRDAAWNPSETSAKALVDFVATTTPADIAAVHVLLTARRIPTLFEEVEPFITDHLRYETGTDFGANARSTRALTTFAMLIAQILVDFHVNPLPNTAIILEQVLRETLAEAPSHDDVVVLHEPDASNVPVPDDDLKSQLAYATFMVVGKSGYTHATISRIARRAHCSPGLVYKLFASKDELVVSAFQDSLNPRGVRVKNFQKVLDRGSLAQSLFDATSTANEVRRDFALEFGLAGAYNPRIRDAVRGQTLDLVAALPLLTNATPVEQDLLASVIRAVTNLTTGVTLLSAACATLHFDDFSQFTEPFRRALLGLCGPLWGDLGQLMNQLADD